MAGHRKWDELRAKMSPERRARNDAAIKAEMTEMLLKEVRKLTGLTQVQVAESMGITQSALSRLEDQDDMHVSTLARLVEALGGKLEIIIDLPTARLAISQFKKTE